MDELSNDSEVIKFKKKILEHLLYGAYCGGSNSAHIGGALSSVDIISILFKKYLKLSLRNFKEKNRNHFILSKGHACLVYYAALCELGFFKKEEFQKFEKTDSFLLGHPIKRPEYGIDFSTGSLGMGVSIGVGVALGLKKINSTNRVYVLLGDGECNEGSIWEGLMTASHFDLHNLVIIVDNNKFQQTGTNTEILDLGNLKEKFSSFGCETYEIDGHSITEIDNALSKNATSKPKAIIAKTTKGKGISFTENDNSYHHAVLTKKLYDQALEELNLK
tara:strand:- start:1801 stop:2628 length:828 start_codon:yes stop_codon:yes gene_type:complete